MNGYTTDRIGRPHKYNKGSAHGMAVIDETKAKYIRGWCVPGTHCGPHPMGESISGISRRFNISRRQVRRILNRENWTHI